MNPQFSMDDPKESLPTAEPRFQQSILWAYFVLAFLEGCAALVALWRIPHDPRGTVFLGLSLQRLSLLLAVLVISLGALGLAILLWRDPKRSLTLTTAIRERLTNDTTWGTTILISLLGALSSSNFLLTTPDFHEPVATAYAIRLAPVVRWVLMLCLQTLLALPLWRYGLSLQRLKTALRSWYSLALTLGAFLILAVWVSRSGYGITPIDQGVGWFPLGPPLLEVEVLLAWAVSMGLLFLFDWWHRRNPHKRGGISIDALLSLLLWALALAVWSFQPLKANWFVSEPRPPNFEFYPNSDASVYDITALNLLLGEGFKTRGSVFTIRPMYAFFLAVSHAISGPGYERVAFLQTALLAFIPVLLYLLTRALHHRVSGVFAALLLILREGNAIHLGDTLADAHARLLLPFLPTALGALLLVVLFVAWLRSPSRRAHLLLAAGGVTGVFMLIRPEIGILLPFLGLAALFQLVRQPRAWLKGMVVLSLGLVLTLTPWIGRNYQLTGTVFLDSPQYRLDLLLRRYRVDPIGFVLPTPSLSPSPLPDETPYPTPPPLTIEDLHPEAGESPTNHTKQLVEEVVSFTQENPKTVFDFILHHFMNNITQTVFQLPSEYPFIPGIIRALGHRSLEQFWQDCCTFAGYNNRLPFWRHLGSYWPGKTILPITINVVLIALGVHTAWKQNRFIGLIPLFAAVGYYLVNALVRNSGGRYIIPLNWVGLLYFAIGGIQVTWGAASLFGRRTLRLEAQAGVERGTWPLDKRAALGLFLGTLLLALALPLAERVIPPRYSDHTLDDRLAALRNSPVTPLKSGEIHLIDTFLANGGDALTGSAFYPRFNRAAQMGSVWNIYYSRPYPHIGFYLSSPHDAGIVLPYTNPPEYFPHASQVLVLGCPAEDGYQALAVFLFSEDEKPTKAMWRSPLPADLGCPLPTP